MQRRGLGPVRCGPSRRREHREPTALKIDGKKKSFHDNSLFADVAIIDENFVENTPIEIIKNC